MSLTQSVYSRFIIFLVLCFLVIFLFPSCSIYSSQEKVDSSEVIGVILPFSSAFTNIANEQKNAIELAAAQSETDVEIVYADSGSDVSGAILAYHELMQQEKRPVAVISCASWVATALHPLTAEDGVFHIVIGSAAFERTAPRHTVRFTLDARMEERQLADYLEAFDRIAVLNMDNGYGNNWANVIASRFGDRLAASVAYDPMITDFSAPLERIKQSNPDALVLLSAGNAATIARQARGMGIDAQFVGTRPIERPELLETDATEGLVYTYPSCDRRHPMVEQYQQKYKARPTIFAMEAYDSLLTLLEAMNTVGYSPDALFDWYAGRTYNGALGKVIFDETGDAIYPYLYKEIKDGAFKVAEFQYAMLLERVREDLQAAFHGMHESVEEAAEQLSQSGLTGDLAMEYLEVMFRENTHAYDVATVDRNGVIVAVYPPKYSAIIGADISEQEQIKRLHATREPVVSLAIDTVEGFTGFDLEHPVFNDEGEMIGSVSVLTEPDIFGHIIKPRMQNFPVEIWVMQLDGRIVYDDSEEEIGRNTFTDPIYAQYPSLLAVAEKMAANKEGRAIYTFLDEAMERRVKKGVVWKTMELHGTEFRIALGHELEESAQ
jgi:ABC-type branched-subunit amino acid transport system substrate-binding protein